MGLKITQGLVLNRENKKKSRRVRFKEGSGASVAPTKVFIILYIYILSFYIYIHSFILYTYNTFILSICIHPFILFMLTHIHSLCIHLCFLIHTLIHFLLTYSCLVHPIIHYSTIFIYPFSLYSSFQPLFIYSSFIHHYLIIHFFTNSFISLSIIHYLVIILMNK